MKLNVKERVVLLGILPAEGNIINLKLVQELKRNLSFSEEEIEKYQLSSDGGKVTWSQESDKEIEIGEAIKQLVKGILVKLNDSDKLHEDQITLYEKFVDAN